MASTVTQVGAHVIVGFDDYLYSGMQMDGAGVQATGDKAVIKDDDNATATKLYTDPGKKITLEGTIKNVGGADAELIALRALKKGSTITINAVKHRVTDVDLKFQRLSATGTIGIIKEDNMTYA